MRIVFSELKGIKYCVPGTQKELSIVSPELHMGIPTGHVLKKVFVYGIGIDEPVMLYTQDSIDADDDSNTTEWLNFFYHFNQLGSVMSITDYEGDVVERYVYDVYGEPTIYNKSDSEVTSQVSPLGNPFMFTGREWDGNFIIGLYHYRARAYNPKTGRFLQRDPDRSLNLYSYVGNQPLVFVDPIGTQREGLEVHESDQIRLGPKETIEKVIRTERVRFRARTVRWWTRKTRAGARAARLKQRDEKTVCCADDIEYVKGNVGTHTKQGEDYVNTVTHTYKISGDNLEGCQIVQSYYQFWYRKDTEVHKFELCIPDKHWVGKLPLTYRGGQWINRQNEVIAGDRFKTGMKTQFTVLIHATVCVVNSIYPDVCAETIVIQTSDDFDDPGVPGENFRTSWTWKERIEEIEFHKEMIRRHGK